MNSPLIGITAYRRHPAGKAIEHSLSEMYVQAVMRAGGVPLLIPVELSAQHAALLTPRLDGLLLSGGGDIQPERYGSQPHPRVASVDPLRDDLEIALVQIAVEQGLPFLGICRGVQVINVALGGTLYEDIASQCANPLRHDNYPDIPRDFLAHAVKAEAGSRLAAITGCTRFEVNSLHHQALRNAAPSLKAVAWAPDGVIEAVELPGHPFGLGVQWHPECIPDAPESLPLFKALVQAAAQ